jgi:hypothetical protein
MKENRDLPSGDTARGPYGDMMLLNPLQGCGGGNNGNSSRYKQGTCL